VSISPLSVELFSARCRLRPPSEEDVAHVFSATRFAGFNDGLQWDAPETEAELRARYRENLRAWSRSQAHTFTVEHRSDARFLGRIALRHDRRAAAGAWELGYWIHPRAQGQGYATESSQTALAFAFTELEATSVSACAATFNQKSLRVLDKLGMVRVATLPEGFLKGGQWIAEYRYVIARGSWRP